MTGCDVLSRFLCMWYRHQMNCNGYSLFSRGYLLFISETTILRVKMKWKWLLNETKCNDCWMECWIFPVDQRLTDVMGRISLSKIELWQSKCDTRSCSGEAFLWEFHVSNVLNEGKNYAGFIGKWLENCLPLLIMQGHNEKTCGFSGWESIHPHAHSNT